MAFIVFWFGESSLTQEDSFAKIRKNPVSVYNRCGIFLWRQKDVKFSLLVSLLIVRQLLAFSVFRKALFQHFLTVEDVDVAVVHGLHLASVEVIDLAVFVGSSFDLADTSLCSLVDNEGICLDSLQVVRAVEQLQLALIGGRV